MLSASAPYFFMSYSREDVNLQQRIITELLERGITGCFTPPLCSTTCLDLSTYAWY